MEQHIRAEFDEIERARVVRVLYAVESESRAWRSDSPDSDYDARFACAASFESYLHLCVEQVLAEKEPAHESQLHERTPEPDAWIDSTFTRVEAHAPDAPTSRKPDWALPDEAFLSIMRTT